MSDDYDKLATLVRNGYGIEEALNHVPQATGTTTTIGGVTLATDAEVSTGTDTEKVPPVSSLKSHQGACKAWVSFVGTGTVTINDDYNVTSITDNGVGDYTVNFTEDMKNTNFTVLVSGNGTSSNQNVHDSVSTKAVGSVRVLHYEKATPALTDSGVMNVIVMGD